MFFSLKNNIKKYFLKQEAKPLFIKNNIEKNFIDFNLCRFGKKNKNKVFYVIRRSPGAGMFSNFIFVLNHLLIAEKNKFIPVVDMQNFTTIYNEKSKINNSYNAWEYYFDQTSNYSLKEVYQSQNVVLSNQKFQPNMSIGLNNTHKRLLRKIKIKNNIKYKANNFFKANFKTKEKILGVHFRGSTYKTARRHAYPSTIDEMIKNLKYLIKYYKYDKIFLVTEEIKYLKKLKEIFKEKIVSYPSFRMDKVDSFYIYPRKKHRFKMGEETLIETIILYKCNGLTYVDSNVIKAAKAFSSKKQMDHEIFFGYNSTNKYIARWKWFLKVYFPFLFGRIKRVRKYY